MTIKKTDDNKSKQMDDDLIASPAEPITVNTASAPIDEAPPAAPVMTMPTVPVSDQTDEKPEAKKSQTQRTKRSSK